MLGRLPSGVVKVDEEPIIPEFGEHLIMVPVHISCKGGRMLRTSASSPGTEACSQLSQESEPRAPRFPRLSAMVQREKEANGTNRPSCGWFSPGENLGPGGQP